MKYGFSLCRRGVKNGFCRRVSVFILSLIAVCVLARSPIVQRAYAYSYGKANAGAEMAMELATGKTLHEYNADAQLPMASTTKIMTALLVAEDCDPDEVITVPDCAVGIEGSSIYLKKGEVISLRDLLYGLMLRSGNDSATALAVAHSGSVEKFVEAMNARAKEMGALHTHFTNPSGLPDENHYTTARDLCLIACNAMKNKLFSEVVGTKSYHGEYRSFVNKNKILSTLKGANGVKTGYTVKAGRCLVSSAERDGMDVVCVVLNCPQMYETSSRIIENCFSRYSLEKIDENKVFMCDIIPCKTGKNYEILIEKQQPLTYQIEKIEGKKKIKAGDAVAKLKLFTQNNLIFQCDLYSIIDSKR